MSRAKEFQKESPDGNRFDFHGIDTVNPADALKPGRFPYALNIRPYIRGRVVGRATESDPQFSLPGPTHSIRRLNDSTPLGPGTGFALISGSGTNLYADGTQVATGLSGNPLSMVPFRPNTSVQPWMYVADSLGMNKVRSDGLTYAQGIEEPQIAPVVATASTTVAGTLTLPGTTIPWSTAGAQNPSYAFGDTTGQGTAPAVIPTPTANTSVQIAAAGVVFIGGGGYAPGSVGGITPTYPGHFKTGGGPCAILCGAFTDALGSIISVVAPSDLDVISVGGVATLLVPTNAVQLQLGINCQVANFSTNTGSFSITYSVTTSAIATAVSLVGNVTAYYWGDSPHAGAVATYIWQNPSDGAGWGPARGITSAVGFTTGSSLLFDNGGQNTPAANPVQWTVFNGAVSSGTTSVFQPALESEGYDDWNMIILGQLFIPAAGKYTFHVNYKDNILWGIGGNASWPGINTIVGGANQRKTVANGSPLLPAPLISGSNGVVGSQSVAVTFPAAGLYPIELDWDFWEHTGRQLTVTCNGNNITPLSTNYKTGVQYRDTYRSSLTGATSNPSPESIEENLPVLANTVLAGFSTDPQVDKIDYYRLDSGLLNWTYIGTSDNVNPPVPFTDTLLDTDVAANPILQFDNFQPFPVIDLPHRGIVSVVGNLVEWVSGDQFNVNWLPGTIIIIGGIAYTLDTRPTSVTTLTAGDVAAGNNLVYESDAPELAAQPMPSMWGPTSGGAFMFACGDPLNPGTIYWTKGNNPDSAPDTNQISLTSPSEPLINGCIANGFSFVYSSERKWVFEPTTTSALATVTGAVGQTWNPVLLPSARGLYIRKCIAVDGGKTIFTRGKDGIYLSAGGGGEQSITDDTLYNLFPHEGSIPTPVVVNGNTIYPPDDTVPESQQFSVANGYLYYDYPNTLGNPCTLVYDIVAQGWIIDQYQTPVITHVLEEGPDANGTLVGCLDGTIRSLSSSGTETGSCILLTPAVDGGELRGNKQIGDLFLRASIDPAGPLSVVAYSDRFAVQITGTAPTSLTGASTYAPYIVDFSGGAQEVDDIELALSWQLDSNTILEAWQPGWIPLPDTIQDRTTDWEDGGYPGDKFVQGIEIEANTFGQSKVFQIQNGDDLSIITPNESPATFSGQSIQSFSWPPFLAHNMRIISSDSVPWRVWAYKYIFKPFPPSVAQWQTELNSLGVEGYGSVREMNIAYISTTALNLTMTMNIGDEAAPRVITITNQLPSSNGQQVKVKVVMPPNKWKLVAFGLTSQ